MPKVTLLRQSCKGVEDCGICMLVCPKRLFCHSEEINEAGYLPPAVRDVSRCTGCRNCMILCPDFAVVVEEDASESSGAGRGNEP